MARRESRKLELVLSLLATDPHNERLWEDLYNEVRPYVFAVAYRALNGDDELAKDATQNTFLKLFRYGHFDEFQGPEEFLGYIAIVARHAALDLRARERRYVTGLDVMLCDFVPGLTHPTGRSRVTLQELLRRLRPSEKRLVTLLMQRATIDQIAAILRISYGAAAVRIHRLRERLRKRLKTR